MNLQMVAWQISEKYERISYALWLQLPSSSRPYVGILFYSMMDRMDAVGALEDSQSLLFQFAFELSLG